MPQKGQRDPRCGHVKLWCIDWAEIKVATKSQAVAHDDEEMYDLKETACQRSKNDEWKESKWAQKQRKGKKKMVQFQIA